MPSLRLGVPTALHVDGIERRRAKWGPFGRLVYALSERLACRLPSALVTDADVIQRHYLERYGADSWMITYGVEPAPPEHRASSSGWTSRPASTCSTSAVSSRRTTPTRSPRPTARCPATCRWSWSATRPTPRDFIRSFRDDADPRIVFPGAIYGDGYRELQQSALAYVHATDVGGTHPALVEAMGYCNCVVVNDTPENREVAGESAYYFRAAQPSSLAEALQRVLADRDETRSRGEAMAERAHARYSWDAVARRYVSLFESISCNA